jgi:hypothetical protein
MRGHSRRLPNRKSLEVPMNMRSLSSPGRFGLVALVLFTLQAHGAPQADAAYQRYQCVVPGGNAGCSSVERPTALYRVVPGPYARYLIHDGMDESHAIAAAKAIGEQTTWQVQIPQEPQQQLTGFQLHERHLGRKVPPSPVDMPGAVGSRYQP